VTGCERTGLPAQGEALTAPQSKPAPVPRNGPWPPLSATGRTLRPKSPRPKPARR